ncbi:hypothetical protein NDU88_004681 [Pleurodeles waltl]|uniref:Uncharacterized protein n=1 Tax=Pleurodeles waltl TaxID=8319 RepID=A0AAV7NND0_PLEWA|nr:hypothetical protein NDU88_004681 [Pleurodeles waltl]
MTMPDILIMEHSKEILKVRAAHMEVALQRQLNTEPVNAVTMTGAEKKTGPIQTCPKYQIMLHLRRVIPQSRILPYTRKAVHQL